MQNLKFYFTVVRQVRSPMADFLIDCYLNGFTAFFTTFLTLSQLLQLKLYLFPTSLNPQPTGAQISLGSLVQPVTGEYFFTTFLTLSQLLQLGLYLFPTS
jgi:hypothetical protein